MSMNSLEMLKWDVIDGMSKPLSIVVMCEDVHASRFDIAICLMF